MPPMSREGRKGMRRLLVGTAPAPLLLGGVGYGLIRNRGVDKVKGGFNPLDPLRSECVVERTDVPRWAGCGFC